MKQEDSLKGTIQKVLGHSDHVFFLFFWVGQTDHMSSFPFFWHIEILYFINFNSNKNLMCEKITIPFYDESINQFE